MCGIVGYTGYRDALPVLLNSLERVTYRGYDSFGVALLNGHGIQLSKGVGTVEEHLDQVGHLQGTLVHNGDIDNFHQLRQRLQDQGHQFRSETDSEVIAHLIESYADDDIVAATSRAIGELEGPFAILVLHRLSRRLLVARRKSPLVVGIGDGETFGE